MSDLVKEPQNFSFFASSGLFLYTKLGPVSGTKFFPNWLKKFPIDLEYSQLAEKSQFKRLTFPILLKIALFFPKIVVYFPKITPFFSQYHRYQKFPKKVRKSSAHEGAHIIKPIIKLLLVIFFRWGR